MKKAPKPRYITIRIQYYPLPKKTILSAILLVFSFFTYMHLPQITQWINSSKSINLKALDTLASPHRSLWRSGDTFDTLSLKSVFVSQKPAEEKVAQEPPLKNDHVINNGPRDKKQVALTFDADMTPQMKRDLDTGVTKSSYNEKIVEFLNQTQTKATIFASGMWVEQYPDVMKELAANPLIEFGNHSYSHPGFDGDCWGLTPLPDEGNEKELRKTQELLKQYTGKDNKFFRFPGGCYSKKDLEDVWKQGMYVVHWDSVGNDGFNDDPQKIETNVLSSAQNGSVIVLHFNGYPNSPKTAYALPRIISELKRKGFEFVKLSELLELNQKPQEEVYKSYLESNINL